MSRHTILLVEDDEDLRGTLKNIIIDEGVYDVVDLPDGLTAMRWLAENERPSIIVSDYLMLGKGSDLARAAHRADLHTIIITGNKEEALEALRGLNVPVVTKPFDPFKLLDLVDSLSGRTLSNPKTTIKSNS